MSRLPSSKQAQNRRYYEEHREEYLKRARLYYAANREKVKAQVKAYQEAHAEESAAWHAAYGKAHRAENNERNRRWYSRHLEVRRARGREQALASYYRHLEANREKARAIAHARRALGNLTVADIRHVFGRSGGKCGLCGKYVRKTERSLDHIIPVALGGNNDLCNLQLAHLFCNLTRHTGSRIPAQTRML